MKVVVAGTGYVGLVTSAVLSSIGHSVTCVDVDKKKIEQLKSGISPIYEEGLDELLEKNKEKLSFVTDGKKAYQDADVIFIGVGTPERQDGSANLDYVYNVCDEICNNLQKDVIVVIKSTVPIGTNDKLEAYMNDKITKFRISVVSNPEFLSQGTAVHDTFYATRIVVGVEDKKASELMKELYKPLTKPPYNVPYLEMNRPSAEMVKYASNDFLALKISYINEIANFCEKLGASISDVTKGMSYDSRIGSKFLNAGLGYGGSCFPKDTKALHWLSQINNCELKTIKACVEINKVQRLRLFTKLCEVFDGNLKGKNIALLGVTFKPGTDDLRESPAIENTQLLLENGALVTVYDPIGLDNLEKIFRDKIKYASVIDDAIKDKDAVLIMTEWDDIKKYSVNNYKKLMKKALILDGRSCLNKEEINKLQIPYYCIGEGWKNYEETN